MYFFIYPISLVVGQLHLKKGVQLSKTMKDSSDLSHVKPSAIPCTTNSSALEIAQTYNQWQADIPKPRDATLGTQTHPCTRYFKKE